MKQGQGGSVINLGSIASIRGIAPDYSIYAATKTAVLGLSRSLALEYAKHKIRFNTILPGVINTPLALEPIRKKVSPAEFQRILGERLDLLAHRHEHHPDGRRHVQGRHLHRHDRHPHPRHHPER